LNEALTRLQNLPEIVRGFFRHPECAPLVWTNLFYFLVTGVLGMESRSRDFVWVKYYPYKIPNWEVEIMPHELLGQTCEAFENMKNKEIRVIFYFSFL
jgi:hypothetical protein